MLLFQYALKREREKGRSRRAADRRQHRARFRAACAAGRGLYGYGADVRGVLAPSAYRGDFARLSLELAPGFVAWCAISSMVNPVFQLAKRTWPLTIAALIALATDLALLHFGAPRGARMRSTAPIRSVSRSNSPSA